MSGEEQITKVPEGLAASAGTSSAGATKVKDPKKVAAGKKLAQRNREAREAQKKLEAMEAAGLAGSKEDQAHASTFSEADSWLMAAAGVAGGCLTLYHAYRLFFTPKHSAENIQQPPATPATVVNDTDVKDEVTIRPKVSR